MERSEGPLFGVCDGERGTGESKERRLKKDEGPPAGATGKFF